MSTVETLLVVQALREAASYTRIELRRKAYLELAAKLEAELKGVKG